MKRKYGISLIVLIITIVVIIILATAIIVNIAQTNLIENANEAVVKQDFKTMQDELTLYKADKYVEEKGNFKAENLNVTEISKIAEIIPSIVGTKYQEYVVIENGKIAISDTMPEKERKWAMEALGLIKTSTNRPTEPEETDTAVVAINTIVETVNATITGGDFTYNNPVIPIGFKAINTTAALWSDANSDGIVDGWNNGLVIQDKNLNEFVWVPIDGTNIEYKKWCKTGIQYSDADISDDIESLPNNIINETAQITKYGGFYIGRYEAGVPANQITIDGESKETSDEEGTPVVKKDATVWTYISYNKAMLNAKKLYETSTSVRSGIVTGTAWDTVCAWIQSETDTEGNSIHDVITDSKNWGNYKNDPVDGDNGKQTAGYSDNWKAKNIYDVAGNTHEWTGEVHSSYRIYRGGYYENVGSYRPASYRRSDSLPSFAGLDISFRLMLYVM